MKIKTSKNFNSNESYFSNIWNENMEINSERLDNMDILSETVLNEIICKICGNVKVNISSCVLCEETFCKSCISHKQSKNEKCVNGCYPIKVSTYVSNNIIEVLENVIIKCQNYSDGCTNTFKYLDVVNNKNRYLAHSNECFYRKIKCNLCNDIMHFTQANKHRIDCKIKEEKSNIENKLNNNTNIKDIDYFDKKDLIKDLIKDDEVDNNEYKNEIFTNENLNNNTSNNMIDLNLNEDINRKQIEHNDNTTNFVTSKNLENTIKKNNENSILKIRAENSNFKNINFSNTKEYKNEENVESDVKQVTLDELLVTIYHNTEENKKNSNISIETIKDLQLQINLLKQSILELKNNEKESNNIAKYPKKLISDNEIINISQEQSLKPSQALKSKLKNRAVSNNKDNQIPMHSNILSIIDENNLETKKNDFNEENYFNENFKNKNNERDRNKEVNIMNISRTSNSNVSNRIKKYRDKSKKENNNSKSFIDNDASNLETIKNTISNEFNIINSRLSTFEIYFNSDYFKSIVKQSIHESLGNDIKYDFNGHNMIKSNNDNKSNGLKDTKNFNTNSNSNSRSPNRIKTNEKSSSNTNIEYLKSKIVKIDTKTQHIQRNIYSEIVRKVKLKLKDFEEEINQMNLISNKNELDINNNVNEVTNIKNQNVDKENSNIQILSNQNSLTHLSKNNNSRNQYIYNKNLTKTFTDKSKPKLNDLDKNKYKDKDNDKSKDKSIDKLKNKSNISEKIRPKLFNSKLNNQQSTSPKISNSKNFDKTATEVNLSNYYENRLKLVDKNMSKISEIKSNIRSNDYKFNIEFMIFVKDFVLSIYEFNESLNTSLSDIKEILENNQNHNHNE